MQLKDRSFPRKDDAAFPTFPYQILIVVHHKLCRPIHSSAIAEVIATTMRVLQASNAAADVDMDTLGRVSSQVGRQIRDIKFD
jgi:hypothetical protein